VRGRTAAPHRAAGQWAARRPDTPAAVRARLESRTGPASGHQGQWRTLLVGTVLVDPALALTGSRWADLPLRTRLSAARAYHGPEATVVGDTAARLHGLEPLPPDDGAVQVRLAPGRERHQQPGVRLHTQLLASEDCAVVDGLPVSSVARTVVDCVLSLRRDEA